MTVAGLGQCSLDYLFVIDDFPKPDTKKEVVQWTASGGGPVATALASLSRLGLESAFYGIIGDDETGEKIVDSLKSENINTTGLIKRREAYSQTAFIAVEQNTGKRTIFWKRPSGDPLHPEELPGDFPGTANLLLLDGLMTDASLYAACTARERAIPVMLDAGRVRPGMLELAGLCDYVVGSEEFARELTDADGDFLPEKAARKIRSLGAGTATVTLGSNGSITLSGDDMFYTPAFPVKTVDTTGAGDVFHGGYIYGILQKWPLQDVVKFASAFAALSCRSLGGRAGIPSLRDTLSLIELSKS